MSVSDTTPTQKLTIAQPRLMQAQSDILHLMNQVETHADDIIALIPEMQDEPLFDLRTQARIVGKACWRIECAADAEIFKRMHAPKGRGKKDDDGVGIQKELARRAADLGLHPDTLRRNAAIHRTFFSPTLETVSSDQQNVVVDHDILAAVDLLKDKTYCEIAMRTENPRKTLMEFAQKKSENAFFNTRDAKRLVEESKSSPDLNDVVQIALSTPQSKAAWEAYKRAADALANQIPTVREIVNGHKEELQYELSRPQQKLRERLLSLISDGWDTVEQLAPMINAERIHCQVFLNRLVEDGTLEEKEMERVPGARGAIKYQYFLKKKKI